VVRSEGPLDYTVLGFWQGRRGAVVRSEGPLDYTGRSSSRSPFGPWFAPKGRSITLA